MNDRERNPVTVMEPYRRIPASRDSQENELTDCDIEVVLTQEAEQCFRGPELLPIRVVKNDGGMDAFLDDDDVNRWRIPIIRAKPGSVVLHLAANLRAYWRWNLLDRND